MDKKKLTRFLSAALIFIVALLLFTACGSSNKKELVSVDVVDVPAGGIYVGKFDEANIKVELTYSDGSNEKIQLFEAEIPEEYQNLIYTPGEHTIEMLYRGFEVSYTIKVKSPFYTVKFLNYYNEPVKVIYYNFVEGTTEIIPPSADEMAVDGYRFTGEFDKSFDRITKDTTIKGKYERASLVSFYNVNGELVDRQYVGIDENAVAPSNEAMEVDGYRFTGEFDKSLENITENTDITGIYVKTYKVTFYNGRNQVISVQQVDVGGDAEEPSTEDRLVDGYVWKRWDRTFTNVGSDISVYGIYVKGYTIHYSSDDESKGTVIGNIASASVVPVGTSVTLTAVPNDGYDFYGWFANDVLISNETTYSFVMSSKTIICVAKFGNPCDINGHEYVTYPAQAPSCTSIGWNEYRICTACGDNNYDPIPSTGHNKVWETMIEATCTTDGEKILYCTECTLEFEREIIPATGHNMAGNECTNCHEHTYTITINYLYDNGSVASDGTSISVWEGSEYSIASPEIDGYIADITNVSGTANTDCDYTVTYTIIELEKITRIKNVVLGNIEYNTSYSNLGLPSTVIAITNTAREISLPVYWDATTYNKTAYGEQVIRGAVSAGYGYVLACDNAVSATLTITENVITAINPMNLGRLPIGTSYDGLGLPSTAGITTSTGAIYYLPVTWNVYSYDSSVEGNHSINGEISLPDGFVLADGISNVATVTFQLSERMYGTADIVFIVDTTGSMYDEIQNVRRNINAFANRLESEGVSVRWALLEYRDITCDGYNSTKVIYCGSSEWFINVSSYETAIASLSVNGGGDREETVVDALYAATLLEDRADAKTFHIVITDADYKNNNQHGISGMSEMISILNASDITASVVTKTSFYNVYRNLTDSTNGILANIDGQFADELWKLCDLIIDDVVYGRVESINIIKNPDKTVYESGDYFNGSGMIVEATYETGRTRTVTVYSVMPCGALQVSDTEIEINYRGKLAYLPITVNYTIIPVTGIAVSQSEISLEVDEVFTIIANILPSNATNQDVVWSTSNSNVATVINGRIAAIGAGTATITVSTLDGLHNTNITVNVREKTIHVENVITSIGAIQIAPDATYAITATVFPANATNSDVVWTSSDESVVTVENGIITSHAEGAATITVTTVDGGCFAKVYVVVTIETSNVSGIIFNSNGTGLSGVIVKAYRYGALVAETVTASNGSYTFDALVYGDFVFVYEKDGYITSEYSLDVSAPYHTIENIRLVINSGLNGTVSGTVADSVTLAYVSNITVNVREGFNNTTGNIIASYITSEDGSYTSNELSSGYYTLEFVDLRGLESSHTYATSYSNVSIEGNSNTICDMIISGGLMLDSTMRVVLTWGEVPRDLDSHLKVSVSTGQYHIYYSNKTPSGAQANLDVDDVSSYGPETVTVTEFYENGIYHYFVHNYTGGGSNVLSNSGATVKVYFGNTLYRTFYVPEGLGIYWDVFTYNSYTGEFTVIDTIVSSQPNY